ncbi:MAG: hypothetical protein GF411_15270 [Candidatus Lokiarchaeota archaeon]|nr:hypothetical protein [Candidatus Lokiarchaeota archaeon]
MNEKLKSFLVRAGAEICKFGASWFASADFSQQAMVYGGMTLLQIVLSAVMSEFAPTTAARKAGWLKRTLGRL